MPHILIIGANGTLGNAAATHFRNSGFTVTAFVRNEEKAKDLKEKGARVCRGDLTDPESLKGICENTDVVLTAAHGLLGKGKNSSKNVDELGHRLLVDEARKSGVKQFIYTSVSGASADHPVDFFRNKFRVEEYLKMSGLNYSILRLTAFMETHAWYFIGKDIAEKGKAAILGPGTMPTNFVAIRDVIAALDAITLNESYYKKLIPVGGPQNLSRNEVADLFGQALNIKPRISHVPAAVLNVLSVILKPVNPGIARIMKLTLVADKTPETMTAAESVAQFGKSPTSMEEFIQLTIQNYRGQMAR